MAVASEFYTAILVDFILLHFLRHFGTTLVFTGEDKTDNNHQNSLSTNQTNSNEVAIEVVRWIYRKRSP
jgi:hypothetical protein